MTRHLLSVLLLLTSLAMPWTAAAAHKSGIELRISVKGARVVVDGETRADDAAQDVTLRLKPGAHTIRVEHDGFQPWEQAVTVNAGDDALHVEVLLKVVPPPAPAPIVKPEEPARTEEVKPPPPPAGPKVAHPIRVGVYEVKLSAGVEPRMKGIVTEALLAEVRKLERISAISMEEIGDMLSFEQKRQLMGCEQDACIAEIAGAMGVDELITADVSTVGESRLFTVRRIDMTHASVKGSANKRLTVGNGEEILAVIGPCVEELFPEYPLRDGRTRGVSKAVAARLNPPPLPRSVFFTTGGVATAGVLVGGYFALRYSSFQQQHDSLARESVSQVVSASSLKSAGNSAVANAQYANISFAVAGGLAITAGVMALFTDWHGYRDLTEVHVGSKVALRIMPDGVLLSWK